MSSFRAGRAAGRPGYAAQPSGGLQARPRSTPAAGRELGPLDRVGLRHDSQLEPLVAAQHHQPGRPVHGGEHRPLADLPGVLERPLGRARDDVPRLQPRRFGGRVGVDGRHGRRPGLQLVRLVHGGRRVAEADPDPRRHHFARRLRRGRPRAPGRADGRRGAFPARARPAEGSATDSRPAPRVLSSRVPSRERYSRPAIDARTVRMRSRTPWRTSIL